MSEPLTGEHLAQIRQESGGNPTVDRLLDEIVRLDLRIEQLEDEREDIRAMRLESLNELGDVREALSELVDLQNGPPLHKHRERWSAAMAKAYEVLKR